MTNFLHACRAYIYGLQYINNSLQSFHVYLVIFSFCASPESIAVLGSRYGSYSGPVLLDDLLCRGTEDNLLQCRTGQGTHQCSDHSQDAGVRCMQETQCEDYSLRLVPNDLTAEELYITEGDLDGFYFIRDEIHRGRVEICMGGEWGSVCYDNSWGNVDATVACRHLGFSPFGE